MFPVNVDLPESTCPINTILALGFKNICKFVYLSSGHLRPFNSLMLMIGSADLANSYYFFYLTSLSTVCC